MFFLRDPDDELTKLLTHLEFGKENPCCDLDRFGANPEFALIAAETIKHGDKSIVVERQTGSWCVLDLSEWELYRSLNRRTLDQVMATVSERVKSVLARFIIALYTSGLLEINNRRFFEPSLFEAGPVSPLMPMFVLCPTDRCNLACKYCFADSSPSRAESMTWDTAKQIVDLATEYPSDCLTFEFTGGEPFLKTELISQVIDYAKERAKSIGKDVNFGIQTNGTLLTPAMLDLVSRHNIDLGLSLDGDEAMNDLTRMHPGNKGCYKDIIRGITLLQQADIPLGVICVVSKNNFRRFNEILGHFASLGFQNAKMNPVTKIGRAKKGWDDLSLDPSEYLEAHVAYLDYLVQVDEPVIEENVFHLIRNISSRVHKYRCMRSQCDAGQDFFTFNPTGHVFPCCSFRRHDELALGHVLVLDKLAGIAGGNAVLSTVSDRRTEMIEECSKCLYKRFCEGGCSLESYYHFGSNDAPHPWCTYYKGIYSEVFKRLADTPELAKILCPEVEVYVDHLPDYVKRGEA